MEVPNLGEIVSSALLRAAIREILAPAKFKVVSKCSDLWDSSPDVIRLVVMIFVRVPQSLRNVEDLMFERDRRLSRDGTFLIEPIWSDIRGRHLPVACE